MSQPEERFERLVAEMLSEAAPSRPPTDLIPNAERAVDDTRRWPRWLASIKEPPMRHSSTLAVGSPTVRVAAILAATLLIALTLIAAGIAGSNLLAADDPIIVDQTGAGTVTTITEAVNMADDGDTILVRPGTYTEAVTIDKNIALLGDGPREEIIIMAPEGGPSRLIVPPRLDPYALLLADTTATLSGLTLRGVSSELHVDGGAPTLEGLLLDGVGDAEGFDMNRGARPSSIVITGGSSAVVQGNTLRGGGPITAYEGSSPSVIDNTLIDGPSIVAFTQADGAIVQGNTISGAPGHAIGIGGPGKPTIESNTISGAANAGIAVGAHNARGTNPIVRDNTIRDARVGITVADQAAPTIEGNTFIRNRTGLMTGYGSDAMIVEANEFLDNAIGITIGRTGGHFEGNAIQGGEAGVVIVGGGSPTLVGNTIEGASNRGLVVLERATPTLADNRVCGNGENLVIEAEADRSVRAANEICDDLAVAALDSMGQ